MDEPTSGIPNLQELSQKAGTIYEEIYKDKLSAYNGKYVAIDVDSKDFFIGETRDEAVGMARKKYPEKLVFIRRIGEIEKISRHIVLQDNGIQKNEYARVFCFTTQTP